MREKPVIIPGRSRFTWVVDPLDGTHSYSEESPPGPARSPCSMRS
ncbi:MAG: hypothetical protein IPI28_07350 [Candidatus Omnitrophica bacterium]|nr:hypothetical protein [Candidatus Omnitrophota bacterium]